MVHSVTGDSAAAGAKTITITLPSNKSRIFIRSISVGTSGGDTSTDVTVTLADNGTSIWKTGLRAAKVFGGFFDFGKGIPVRNGNATVACTAGGAGVVLHVSVVYEIV